MSSWRRRTFDAPGLTQVPAGPYVAKLARRWTRTISVTSPGYDDIGQILSSMRVEFAPFRGNYDADLLFANCGTHDPLDPDRLRHFVDAGGCVYASDLTSSLIDGAFPGKFQFSGSGQPGSVAARVADPELREVVGERTTVHFDLGGWALLDGCDGETLVEAGQRTAYPGRPLMVEVGYGNGAVFYTSFHNRAQASKHERTLLKLLVLKQLSASSNTTVAEAGRALGINVARLKAGPRL